MFLIFLLTTYFIFLGCGPSIMRAWFTILVVILGMLMEKQGSGLNALGVALLTILTFDPLMSQNMGFQFSFITTAAILLIYFSIDFIMQKLFLKRNLSKTIGMKRLDKHGYVLLTILRQGLALGIAVNLVALPMTLYFFHKFPFLSLLYNLFFPFMVSFSMLLLIVGSLFSFTVPFVGTLIHEINSVYTNFMLNFTYNTPTTLDYIWRLNNFPLEILVGYLCTIFLLGILSRYYLEKRLEAMQDFAFL